MRNFFIALTRNPISLAGTALATASAVIIVTLFAIDLVGRGGGPYVGILAYLVLPGLFVLGLLIIPIGIARERRLARRAAARGEAPPAFPVIDLNRGRTRTVVLTFLGLTAVNAVVLATATYKGVEVMESTEFCGATCHTVMQPEYTAYQRSPHARVPCVECHVGSGADWFVRSKLSGTWQVIAVTFDLTPRPIPTPVHNLRPARETCEQCHWPVTYVGDRLKVITSYADDEANSELKTVLLMRVGGVQGRTSQGIHWHVDPGVRIRYRGEPSRETIYDVELTRPDGTVTTFSAPPLPGGESMGTASEVARAAPSQNEWRTMDCLDCHNRPAHTLQTPARAIDEAIRERRIDRSLPFVRKEGLELIQQSYPSHEAARDGIATALAAYYRDNHPEVAASQAAAIDEAGRALGDVYAVNVFPAMKVTWGTYPNHLGHADERGCFRCHDDAHTDAEGQTIAQDCFACHNLLAMEEAEPQVLTDLQP